MRILIMNPDRLAELEEQRRFLLRSLADLEREHDAGDVDEVDYHELKDGYTVRAAATLREIEGERSALPEKPPADWRRRILTGISVVGLIALVWWALAASSAQRAPGQQITGFDPRTDRQVLLSQARALQFEQPGEAAVLYGLVLDASPNDVEALTYRGWTLALDAMRLTDADLAQEQLVAAIDALGRAIELDPDYPDPRCFLGIVQANFLGDAAAARDDLTRCLAADPPADVRGLVQGLLDRSIVADEGSVP